MHLGLVFRLAAIGLASLLAACAHLPPTATPGCRLPAYRLVISDSGLGSAVQPARNPDNDAFRNMVSNSLRNAHAVRGEREDVLILSGGSQHGAFGAGFFAGLAKRKTADPAEKPVPDYVFVTGVSTGALVSTLVFLANSDVKPGRRYPAYMKGTGVSNLEDNASIFSVDRESRIIRPWKGGVLEGVVKGSLATFTPLRSLIFGMLSDETLSDIKQAYNHGNGRHLLIGVTNLESGAGYAIDLTQYVDGAFKPDANNDPVRTCYIDALLASSSVPPGMTPVSLTLYNAADTETEEQPALYIDGGARFGVFWGQLDGAPIPDLKRVTMLINGTLSAGPWEEFAKKPKWSILSVAKRSSEILVNQVYRFSVDKIEMRVPAGVQLSEALISNVGLLERYGPEAAIAPDLFIYPAGDQGRTCRSWFNLDHDEHHPLEFHPRYMQCLVAYGRMRGEAAPWNNVIP